MDKKKLLSEELKRHQQLLEYSFYVPEETKEKDDADLLFDGILNEQDPVGDEEVEDAKKIAPANVKQKRNKDSN